MKTVGGCLAILTVEEELGRRLLLDALLTRAELLGATLELLATALVE